MIEKAYEIIDKIEKSDFKNKLSIIKHKISISNESKNIIKEFNNAKELYEKYGYKEEFVKAKIKLLKDPLISQYIQLQNKINMLTIQINNRIKSITNKK